MSDKKLEVPAELLESIDEGVPTIKVSRSIGFTVNLQGFESARIDATVEVTGRLENKDKVVEFVDTELTTQIQKQIRDVVEQHNPNKTLLGYSK